jgi:hypothetical protein
LACCQAHPHLSAQPSGYFNPHRIPADLRTVATNPDIRSIQAIAGCHIELPAVTRTGERPIHHRPTIKPSPSVGATVLHGVNHAARMEDGNLAVVDQDDLGLTLRDLL